MDSTAFALGSSPRLRYFLIEEMETTINGVRFGVKLWPTLLAALLVGAALLMAWRSRTQVAPVDRDAAPDLRGGIPVRRVLTSALGTLLLIAMLPPVCSGGVGYVGKLNPQFFDELFFPLLAGDWLIVIIGALIVIRPAGANAQQNVGPVLALLGALIALGSAWSIRLAKWHPELATHSCTNIQKGHTCTPQAWAPRGWQVVNAPALRYDQPGDYKVPLELRHGLAHASGLVTVHVGEERGSPWFSPRVGDVWRFSFKKSSTSAVLFVLSSSSGQHEEEGPTLRAMRELEAHGRRWLQLEVESPQRDKDDKITLTKEHVWSYFLDGETFVLPEQDGAPKWQALDSVQRAVVRPDLEPMPTEPRAQQARERTLARVPDTQDGLIAVTVPCVFSLFELSCRCAERGIDARRSLPGPVLCNAGGSGLKTVGLLLLTAFTVLVGDSTLLAQSESANQAGLPPPLPPLTYIPTLQEFELSQAEAEAARPQDAERQAYSQRLSLHIPAATRIPYCVERYARRRHGSVTFSSLIDRAGKVIAVSVTEPAAANAQLKECIGNVVRGYEFEPPPHGAIRVESTAKF